MNREKALSMVKELALFIFVTACAFGWWMLLLLIISFITLSLLHLTIEMIFVLSIVGTIAVDIYYVISRVKKFRKEAEEELRKSMYN